MKTKPRQLSDFPALVAAQQQLSELNRQEMELRRQVHSYAAPAADSAEHAALVLADQAVAAPPAPTKQQLTKDWHVCRRAIELKRSEVDRIEADAKIACRSDRVAEHKVMARKIADAMRTLADVLRDEQLLVDELRVDGIDFGFPLDVAGAAFGNQSIVEFAELLKVKAAAAEKYINQK